VLNCLWAQLLFVASWRFAVKGKKAMNKYLAVLSIAVSASIQPAAGAGCENPRSSQEVANCLGGELRDSDARINQTYQGLIKLLSEDEQKTLRMEQRSWIKERDMVCSLDTREKDRERWYRALLSDYSKTVCVTRYTRVRTAELDRLLSQKTQEKTAAQVAAPQPRPELFPKDPQAYWARSGQTREKGRWYWEVSLNVDEIAKLHPTTLWMGCANPENAHGGLLNIRSHDSGYGVQAVGVALDLQDGKMYLRDNGSWNKGAPGSAKGLDLKLGRTYKCGLTSTIALSPLEKLNFVEINFGNKPFKYALPDGYRPFAP
jgi:uncharacterized protein YecT (DUF1311 family)